MMTKFAILSGNTVTNTINANSLEEASVLGTAIQYTDENPAYIGGTYDFEIGKFFPLITEETVEQLITEETVEEDA
jgi:hypothetical protein